MSLLRLEELNNELKQLNDGAFEIFEIYHQIKIWISNISIEINRLKDKYSKFEIKSVLADSIEIHSESDWINRLQSWPRAIREIMSQ